MFFGSLFDSGWNQNANDGFAILNILQFPLNCYSHLQNDIYFWIFFYRNWIEMFQKLPLGKISELAAFAHIRNFFLSPMDKQDRCPHKHLDSTTGMAFRRPLWFHVQRSSLLEHYRHRLFQRKYKKQIDTISLKLITSVFLHNLSTHPKQNLMK